MPDRAAFLSVIRDNPDDDGPRLVYADWLEEHGESAHAELIRVQCALATLSEDSPDRERLEQREAPLLKEHQQRWFGGARIDHVQVQRGFITKLRCNPREYARHEWVWQRFAPVLRFDADYGSGDPPGGFAYDLAALSELPSLVNWVEFGLSMLGPVDGKRFGKLIRSPALRSLTYLGVIESTIGPDGVAALAESPVTTGVRHLTLDCALTAEQCHSGAGDAALRDILGRAGSVNWERLRFDDFITSVGLQGLCASPHVRGVRILHVAGDFAAADISHLTQSPHLSGLELLEIGGWDFDAETLRMLGCWPERGSLKTLSLIHRGLEPDEIRALTASPAFKNITYLNAQVSSDEAVAALASSPHVSGLRRLRVSTIDARLSGAAVRALAASSGLVQLERLEIYGCDCGANDLQRLRNSPALPSLKRIDGLYPAAPGEPAT